ncbi:MFS transporter [Microbacterium kyungheense]|uniref:Na+/melibiose symporter-like transporter n=1 Tax=Microbacterium kyungheense TaxID=1263636 RepID=A0A543EUL9_9MICO|nr:MFS transporter [Microbacterium kyungheense]TQM25275.1 Na+/melibiose symporter-like transporter [Microbacterium kyungheense]
MTAPSEPIAPMTTNTFVENATGIDDPPAPVKGLRRLMWSIVPANIAIFMVWGAVPGILLPQQVTLAFGDENQINVANLAIISTIGAFAAMIAQPIAGQISDRTRSRFGRRAPWIVLGSLAGALSLVGLAFANSLVGFIIAWTLVQVCFNFAQGPLSAVMPDRVPIKRRGTFAALTGIGLMLGAIGGQIVGALFFDSISFGYIVFAALSVVVLLLFVVLNPDYPSTKLQPEPFDLKEFLSTFWVSPTKHPDFFWAFTGRLLLYTGYFAVTGYQLYLLQYYFHIDEPKTVIPLLGLLSLVGIIISTVVSGPLSDKVGRRKPFVFGSAAVVSLAFLLPWFWQDINAWMIMTFIAGFGFGMFQAVDTALISEVLPSAKSFAKDLGVVNIAATLPQTLAPAVSGVIVLVFGYQGLFPVAIVLGILGAIAIWPIKAVR